ncbi:MAG: hypothetical protein WBJ36_12980 [Tenuifilum sp.]|uniref:hypothetical protein n=1 Tax=Tenuifilum sp. TaxID=2760880 RepID=UPI003CB1827E
MGAPWVELPRDTIRHACGVTHVVSLTKSTATFHPRPIAGSGFYANVAFSTPFSLRKKGLGEVIFHEQLTRITSFVILSVAKDL